jgi:predicted GTPase
MQSDLPEAEKNRRLSLLLKASSRKLNIMLVGATGAGKSSTINALFDMSVAEVGVGVDPQTDRIDKYDLGNLTIWDTPGLGDTIDNDKAHIKQIVRKLSEAGDDGNLLIDLVLVVLDASSKDLAVSYDVINNTLIPCLGKGSTERILLGLNQCDMSMKGRHWDFEQNAPDSVLKCFLTKKVNSVKQRVSVATGVSVNPVYYSAGYTDDDGEQQAPYNLSKLLYYILMAVPSEKRLVLVDKLNATETNWESNDGDYSGAVKQSFFDSLLDSVFGGMEHGAVIGGCVIGVPGILIGGLVGAVVGGLHSLIIKPLEKFKPLEKLGEWVKLILK